MVLTIPIYQMGRYGKIDYQGSGGQAGWFSYRKCRWLFFPRSGSVLPIDLIGQRVLSDLESFSISLSCDDKELDQGKGSNALGNPINAVVHLIEVLSRQRHLPQLQANELVTTGTLTAALSVKNGQKWSTALAGIALPGISVSFGE